MSTVSLWHRMRLMVAQGVATLVGGEHVQVTVLDGETLPKVRRVEPYGVSSRPKPGAQVYMVFPSGDRAQGVALVIGDKRYQMELSEGEVALHDDQGNFVKLGSGGVATVRASAKVMADTPRFETVGDVVVGGKLQVTGAATFASKVDVMGVTALANNLTVTGAAAVAGALTAGGLAGGDASAGALQVSSKVVFAGDIEVTGKLTQSGKDVGAGHKHASAAPGAPTSPVI